MAFLTLHWSLDVTLVFLAVFVAAYLYMTRNFSYWKKKGLNEIRPVPFFGNFLDCCLFRMPGYVKLWSMHEQGKNLPFLGFYVFDKPALLLRDPQIIKSILVKDFNYFIDRYANTDESDTIGRSNMFLLKGANWRIMRHKISPIFSTAKLQNMFQLMLPVGEELDIHLDALKLQGDGQTIEVKGISASFTTDVITSCAFGVQGNALNDPEAAFRKCGVNMFGFVTYKRCAEFASIIFLPAVVKLLKLTFFSKEASDFMRKVITETMTVRTKSNIHRNDLIDLLIQLNKSQIKTDDPDALKFEGDTLVGQAATFFAAGFEASATVISFTLYELALQPNIQSKLREEIISALDESGGKITYEMVMSLPYLDMVVAETLRKYPSLSLLDRVAIRDYEVPGTDVVIEKGTPVYTSLLGLHYDPEYFSEPEVYDPERFSEENKRKRPSCVYMPFGEGPRNCVGLRFGLLTSKFGILKFILNCEVTPCKRTLIPMRFDHKAFLVSSDGGLYLNARRITTDMESWS